MKKIFRKKMDLINANSGNIQRRFIVGAELKHVTGNTSRSPISQKLILQIDIFFNSFPFPIYVMTT